MNNQIQRSECLYNGEIIGIESIYTVINGCQINIPEKVEALREKGRKGLLECPCGCGTKLILVASDKGLRQQHFRARNGNSWNECTLKQEGMNSIDSKVVIKCWLADKIDQNIETRVPLNKFSDTERRYEVSHYIPSVGFAINYTNLRLNLEDEKLEILDKALGSNVLYIVDKDNFETFGQYPEYMNKIQKRQNYCLFLEIEGRDYDKAFLNASFYIRDLDGMYKRIELCEGYLKDFCFSEGNKLIFQGRELSEIYSEKKSEFLKQQEDEQKRRDKEKRKAQERLKELEAERQKREAERKAAEEKRKTMYSVFLFQQNNQEKHDRILASDSKLINNTPNTIKKPVELNPEQERIKIEKEIDFYIDRPYYDSHGERWFKCTECKKIGKRNDFEDIANAKGTCKECYRKIHGEQAPKSPEPSQVKTVTNSYFCPWCGSELVKRYSQYGPFWGCSAFPRCAYKRKIY